MTAAATKDRMEMRVLRSEKELVTLAAELEGIKVSRFVWDYAIKRARKIVARAQRITTTEEGYRQILDALENPPEPNTELKNAMSQYPGNKAK
jgi:uncharacterized protein (DUF1778 family)